MARITTIIYSSDLTGSEIEAENADIQFALDGTTYEIDLTSAEQQVLRDVLTPYIEAARRVDTSSTRRRMARTVAASGGPTSKEIRAWASENGHEVPARGRIPAPALEAYHVAHP